MMKLNDPTASERLPNLKGVGVDQHLNEQVPLDLAFRDENGNAVRLGDYFGSKPVILNLAYYQCTMLCGEVMNGMVGSLKALQFDIGKEFNVLTVSFDPRETPQMATDKKKQMMQRYRRPGAPEGWHFLTGDAASVNALTKTVGFDYQYDPKADQYAHAAAIMVLTPRGKLSKYFYGVDFAPKDLRLGLIEASENKIGTLVDQVLLYCYHYNPSTGKYGAVIMNILRLAGGATVFILGSFVIIMLRRDAVSGAGTARIG